jgi:hypothetical protein
MFNIASRTAFAISVLWSMNDWLSIAVTFTVICGAKGGFVLPLTDCPEPGAAVEAAALGAAEFSVASIATGEGGV